MAMRMQAYLTVGEELGAEKELPSEVTAALLAKRFPAATSSKKLKTSFHEAFLLEFAAPLPEDVAPPGASGRGRSTKSVLSGPFAVHVRMAPRGQQGRRGAKLRKIAGPRPRPKARARTQATRVSNGCISLVVPELAVAIRTRGKRVLAAQVPAAHCAHGNRSTSGRRVRSWDGCIIRHSVQRGLNDSRR